MIGPLQYISDVLSGASFVQHEALVHKLNSIRAIHSNRLILIENLRLFPLDLGGEGKVRILLMVGLVSEDGGRIRVMRGCIIHEII